MLPGKFDMLRPDVHSVFLSLISFLNGSPAGDLISAVLASGLKQLVQLPTGCGEQNLALLAANVFTLEYLASSGQSGHPLERQLKENIIKGDCPAFTNLPTLFNAASCLMMND